LFKIIYFFLFLSVCIRVQGRESLAQKQQLEKIEKNIVALEKEKNRYQKKRAGHLDKGALWQFHKDHSLESKREYFLADKDQDKIQLIDLKIKNLIEQKQELLEELGLQFFPSQGQGS
jgi:hypothetical protein